jgi:PAS domain S-box-containing protein
MLGERSETSSQVWLDLGSGWLFEHIRDAVIVVDAESTTIRLWNPAAAQLFGFTSDEVNGQAIGLILPDLVDRATWLELVAAAVTADSTEAIELRGRRRSNTPLAIEAAPSLIHAPVDGHQFLLLVVREASERRLHAALVTQRFLDRASSELASSLEYDTTLHTMARLALPHFGEVCLVYAFDQELSVEQVAAAHLDPAHESRLMRVLDHQLAGERERKLASAALQVGRACVFASLDAVWAQVASTEDERTAMADLGLGSFLVVPVLGRGTLRGVMVLGSLEVDRYRPDDVALAEDLARRCALALDNALLYRTAQHAIAARDQFLSIASHELRAPLARLKSHAEVLLQAHSHGHLDQDRLAWSLQRINAAVDRLAALTKDVLDLSRLRGGQFPFRPSAVDLVGLVRDLEGRFADQLGIQHRLVLELDGAACPVLVDQDRIEQIVTNLLDNAAKYSPLDGDVRLRVERGNDGVLLSVQDQGLGLPAGAEEQIFEAFGRASNAEHLPGMGLGLHICRIIVERHGGRIWATSNGEHRGTTISVWLPFADASPLPVGDVQQRLTNQLTLALGYCELLASNPDLPPALRAQAVEAMQGARGAAATLEDLQKVSR